MKTFRSRRSILLMLYAINFFLSFHFYFLLYIQSSFITQFISENLLLYVYGGAALISLLLFLIVPKILERFMDTKIAFYLTVAEVIFCVILATNTSASVIVPVFIMQQGLLPIISFVLDILIDHNSKIENTGRIRGLTFTAANIALVISPFLVGSIVQKLNLPSIYFFSLIMIVPLFILFMPIQNRIAQPVFKKISIKTSLHALWSNKQKGIRQVFMINLILQMFYTWMVIYSPLYLLKLGFNWSQIGLIFSVMLLPFLILELPLGFLADTSIGHKKILFISTFIMSLSTLAFALCTSPNIILWMLILFMTRVGASGLEMMSESYFFKHIEEQNVYDVSLFRATRPISQLIAPVIASMSILYFGDRWNYVVLSLLILLSLIWIVPLNDNAPKRLQL